MEYGHVCCPGKPMANYLIQVLDYFGLLQHINRATHVLEHILDLMSYGLSIDNITVEDIYFPAHMPIIFNTILSSPLCTVKAPGHYPHYINPLTANQFTEQFLL